MIRTTSLLLALALLVGACSDDDSAENNNLNNANQSQGVCGDGHLDSGEECDNGTANSDDQPDACRTDCRLPWCGDGVVDATELCDDGNGSNNDGCLTDCNAGPCCLPNVCGDGFQNRQEVAPGVLAEACDDGNTADGDACRGDCGQDMTECGDGLPDQGEQCDDAGGNSDTVADACRTDCRTAHCGDGVTDTGEDCDHGAANSDTLPDACRTDCATAICGDGVVDSGEECDGANLGGLDCTDYGYVDPVGLACDGCVHDTSGCAAVCGNGVREPGEACDDNDAQNGDGCSATCAIEPHWTCDATPGQLSVCSCLPQWSGPHCETCTIHVKHDAPAGTQDGLSWATAFRRVQDGIDTAHAAGPGCDVWVHGGDHHVFQTNASDTIFLRDGVAVYGGFAGTESSPADRVLGANPTTLYGGDGSSPVTYVDFVVTASHTTDATLDGFGVFWGSSGGMRNDHAAPWVQHCQFVANNAGMASGMSAGMYNAYSSPTVVDCVFEYNSNELGAGMHNMESAPIVMGCVFRRNRSDLGAGGGMLNDASSPIITDSTFIFNMAREGGGLSNYNDSAPRLTNCAVIMNGAWDEGGDDAYGGGVWLDDFGATATLINCTLFGNWSEVEGGGIYVGDLASVTVTNSIVWGNVPQGFDGTGTATVTWTDEQDGTFLGQPGVVSDDPNLAHAPLFVDYTVASGSPDSIEVRDATAYAVDDVLILGNHGSQHTVTDAPPGTTVTFAPDFLNPTPAGLTVKNWGPGTTDFHLDLTPQPPSVCIDAADDSVDPPQDILGNPRADGDQSSTTEPDMGAYEYQP